MKPRGSYRRKMNPEPRPEEIMLRLTLYGRDAIDLRRMAEIAGASCSAVAKGLLLAILDDDRVAHEEEGRVG